MTKKSPPTEDIGTKLARLALTIADKAMEDDVPLVDRLDAFKALTTYHVNTTKINAKQTPEDEGESNFDNFRKRIETATGGTGSGNSVRNAN